MASRLADSLSPYLRQHAGNPVDWWEWGAEAFAEARRRDAPILLSVGYAACHWCHVMAHESFEDPTIAARINANYVAIKVDREERPDVDAAYMEATTALTGRGGWPMTCLLTPDGAPFHAGTYYPPLQFAQLLEAGAATWAERRDAVLHSAAHIGATLREHLATRTSDEELSAEGTAALSDAAAQGISREEDHAHGGFGGAPKFPPSMALLWLLRRARRTGDDAPAELAARTLHAMTSGGMYDQIGGGFARYAVDATWTVPHFEKMLYDNALLLRASVEWLRASADPAAARVAGQTADFLLAELRTDEGGFAASLDADTDGVEGLTYTWTPAELTEVLGEQDGAWAAQVFGVTPHGSFEEGRSVLQRRDPIADEDRLQRVAATLLRARTQRPQPGRDDKVVASWNGLTMAALAEAGVALDRPELIESACAAATFVVERHLVDGSLRRVSLGGRVGDARGMLDDHGNLAEGLLVLHEITGDERWLQAADDLVTAIQTRFVDDGALRDTPSDGAALYVEHRATSDGAEPSGVSAAVGAALRLAALTGQPELAQQATRWLAPLLDTARQAPRFAGWALAALETVAAGSPELAIVLPDGATSEERAVLVRAARAAANAGQVTVAGPTGAGPLLIDRRSIGDAATYYRCAHGTCAAPTTQPDDDPAPHTAAEPHTAPDPQTTPDKAGPDAR